MYQRKVDVDMLNIPSFSPSHYPATPTQTETSSHRPVFHSAIILPTHPPTVSKCYSS